MDCSLSVDDFDEDKDAYMWVHAGDKCPSAGKVFPPKTGPVENLTHDPSSCSRHLPPEVSNAVHLHLLVWQDKGNCNFLQCHALRAFRGKNDLHIQGESIKAGGQAMVYLCTPPRVPVVCMETYMPTEHNPSKKECRLVYNDYGHTLADVFSAVSIVTLGEMGLRKRKERAEVKESKDGGVPKIRKSEQNFNLFLKVMELYAVTDLSELPRLKEVMERQGDAELARALHVATINPQLIRAIWQNAKEHYRVQEQGKTLQEFIDRYVKLHGTDEQFDLDSNKSIMSVEDSKKALSYFLERKGLKLSTFTKEIHQIFNREGDNTKKNSMLIYGASNAGKSWVLKPIQRAAITPSLGGRVRTSRSLSG